MEEPTQQPEHLVHGRGIEDSKCVQAAAGAVPQEAHTCGMLISPASSSTHPTKGADTNRHYQNARRTYVPNTPSKVMYKRQRRIAVSLMLTPGMNSVHTRSKQYSTD